jgi:hypothetical protein
MRGAARNVRAEALSGVARDGTVERDVDAALAGGRRHQHERGGLAGPRDQGQVAACREHVAGGLLLLRRPHASSSQWNHAATHGNLSRAAHHVKLSNHVDNTPSLVPHSSREFWHDRFSE